jgi:hypothetical protein
MTERHADLAGVPAPIVKVSPPGPASRALYARQQRVT